MTQALVLDEQKLNEFIGKAVGDFGTTLSTALVVIGDQLGLYRALAARPSLRPSSAKTLRQPSATCVSGS